MRGLNTNSLPRSGLPAGGMIGPAGEHLGEAGDVVLGVDAAHAERMQLEDLAREVLVEAGVADEAGHGVGADRARVVEIDQHRRVAFRRQQHVGEAAEHMRPDRLALVGAGHARHRRRPRCRNGSTRTRPAARRSRSPHWPPPRGAPAPPCRNSAAAGSAAARPGSPLDWPRSAAPWVFHRRTAGRGALLFGLALRDLLRLPFGAEVEGKACGLAGAQQVRCLDSAGVGPVELGEKRAARIGCDRGDRAGARPKAEAVQRQRGRGVSVECHGCVSRLPELGPRVAPANGNRRDRFSKRADVRACAACEQRRQGKSNPKRPPRPITRNVRLRDQLRAGRGRRHKAVNFGSEPRRCPSRWGCRSMRLV